MFKNQLFAEDMLFSGQQDICIFLRKPLFLVNMKRDLQNTLNRKNNMICTNANK